MGEAGRETEFGIHIFPFNGLRDTALEAFH